MTDHHVVLVVEDQEDPREMLAMLLDLAGYRSLTAADGVEALEALRAGPVPCVVLMDLMMPRMDGWEASRRIASDPDLPKPPVLVISGAADVDDGAEALPVAGFLRKPIDPDSLLRAIERLCARGRSPTS